MEFSPQVSINKTNVSTEYSSLFLSSRCTVAFTQLDLLDTGVDVCARKANGVQVEFFKCDLHPWKDRSYLSRYMTLSWPSFPKHLKEKRFVHRQVYASGQILHRKSVAMDISSTLIFLSFITENQKVHSFHTGMPTMFVRCLNACISVKKYTCSVWKLIWASQGGFILFCPVTVLHMMWRVAVSLLSQHCSL